MAQHRHKRETNARLPRTVLVAAPLAVVATMSAVTMGVLSADPAASDSRLLASSAGTSLSSSTTLTDRRDVTVSRSSARTADRDEAQAEREAEQVQARERRERRAAAAQKADRAERQAEREAVQATLRAVRSADDELWTTAPLNLWDAPGQDAVRVDVLEEGIEVLVTGRRQAGRAEVVIDGTARWVSVDYLSAEKPAPPKPAGPTMGGQCANGSSIDAGRSTLYEIHDAVCSNWPEITAYGTWRGDGEHGQGRAMDIMVSGATGWEVANFLRANYSAFGIEYLIYSQNIWSVERGGEGWRGMSDRGSTTANHYDHVHVTVY